MAYDLLIRNGIVVDGTGFSRYRADVAIQDGTIVGKIRGAAAATIDADGHVGSQELTRYLMSRGLNVYARRYAPLLPTVALQDLTPALSGAGGGERTERGGRRSSTVLTVALP
jgi:hypothetical protein